MRELNKLIKEKIAELKEIAIDQAILAEELINICKELKDAEDKQISKSIKRLRK